MLCIRRARGNANTIFLFVYNIHAIICASRAYTRRVAHQHHDMVCAHTHESTVTLLCRSARERESEENWKKNNNSSSSDDERHDNSHTIIVINAKYNNNNNNKWERGKKVVDDCV